MPPRPLARPPGAGGGGGAASRAAAAVPRNAPGTGRSTRAHRREGRCWAQGTGARSAATHLARRSRAPRIATAARPASCSPSPPPGARGCRRRSERAATNRRRCHIVTAGAARGGTGGRLGNRRPLAARRVNPGRASQCVAAAANSGAFGVGMLCDNGPRGSQAGGEGPLPGGRRGRATPRADHPSTPLRTGAGGPATKAANGACGPPAELGSPGQSGAEGPHAGRSWRVRRRRTGLAASGASWTSKSSRLLRRLRAVRLHTAPWSPCTPSLSQRPVSPDRCEVSVRCLTTSEVRSTWRGSGA